MSQESTPAPAATSGLVVAKLKRYGGGESVIGGPGDRDAMQRIVDEHNIPNQSDMAYIEPWDQNRFEREWPR